MAIVEDRIPASARDPLNHLSIVPGPVSIPISLFRVARSHQTGTNFSDFLTDWKSLADSWGEQPYLFPSWVSAYLTNFEPLARVTSWSVRKDNQVVAVLPLVSENVRMFGVPVRRLRPPLALAAPTRFDILTGVSDRSEIVQALWLDLKRKRDWDVIELVDLPDGGPGWNLLETALADGFHVGSRVSRLSPYIDIPTGTRSVDEILGNTTAKFRANVRRRRRNLERLGEVKLIRTTNFDEAVMSCFFKLEHSGWKGRNQTSLVSTPGMMQYYTDLARSAGELGQLSMYSLKCDGIPVAMHFGVMIQGRYSVPKLAFSEDYHEYAPGHLLIHDVLQDLVARNCIEFDFQGDQTSWKEEWTHKVRTHFRAHIFNNTISGRTAHSVRYGVAPVARSLSRKAISLSGAVTSALILSRANS